jgi:sulfur relay protein TusB/DsrH
MTKIAYLILKSPQDQDPTHLISRLSDAKDASAILIEDGVYQALQDGPSRVLASAAHEVLVSKEDMEARGFSSSDLRTGRAVDYEDIVDCIMERTARTVTI